MQRVVTFDLAAVTAEMKRRPAPLVPPTPRRSQRSRYRSIRRSRAKADRCQRLKCCGCAMSRIPDPAQLLRMGPPIRLILEVVPVDHDGLARPIGVDRDEPHREPSVLPLGVEDLRAVRGR